MNKIIKKIFIITFFSILLFFMITTVFNNEKISMTERRNLKTFPSFSLKNLADKKYYDDRGTSLVILQSEKGKDLYEQIKSKFIFSEVDLEDAIKYNIAINNSVEMNKGRKRFFKNIDRYNYQKLFEISTKVTVIQRIINFMRKIKYKIGIKFKMV